MARRTRNPDSDRFVDDTGAMIVASQPLSRLVGPTKVSVDTASKTLAELGLTLNASTKGLRIITPTAGIYWNYGTATTNSCPLLTGTNETAGENSALLTLEFIVSTGTVDMWVEELG